jgi:heat shock protein 4
VLCCDSATLVGFTKGKMRVIASACERNAGGRDVDAAIARHFAREFQVRHTLRAVSLHAGVSMCRIV